MEHADDRGPELGSSGVANEDLPTQIATPVQTNAAADLPAADEAFRELLLRDGGARIGRYVILRHLDDGGMGTVFAAYDEELDRRVALKLLRSRASEGSLGRTRLLREAQALAKLAHPNVVTVFDVGEVSGQIFVAMELVSGQTMRRWCKGQRRSWSEIVEVFLQAGRGLAAAHKAGLVHRDFKPSNVIVGDDGRVRVLDFGLALARIGASESQHEGRIDDTDSAHPMLSSSTLLCTSLTTDGAVAGTPAYMAPEQVLGATSDARSDQYSFGVSLFEALVGVRPHSGRTLDERRAGLVSAPEVSFPRGTRAPAWLRRVVLRALALDSERRFVDMEALLAALGRDRHRSRRRGLVGLALASTIGLGVASYVGEGAREAQRCRGGERVIAGLWSEDRQATIHEAIVATGLPYADASWARLQPIVREYGDAWARIHHETCEARRQGELTDHLHDLAMACLDRRRATFAALLDALEAADRATVASAIQATRSLPELARCSDAAALIADRTAVAGPEIAGEIVGLRARLGPARVALLTHHSEAGLRILEPIGALADALAHDPLRAEVLALRGLLLADGGHYDAAAEALTRALWLADVVGDDLLLAEVMAELVFLTGDRMGRLDEAIAWRPHAEALSARLGRRSAAHARLLWAFGTTLTRQNRGSEAIATLSEALQIERAVFGESQRIVQTIVHLGNAHFSINDFAGAQGLYERALAILERELGPDHPELASTLDNVGAARASRGDLSGALLLFRRSVEIEAKILGPDHPELAPALANIGIILATQGQRGAARAHFERAIRALEQGGGRDHPNVASSLIRLAALDRDEGELARARVHLDRAAAIALTANGPDDPLHLWAESELGELDLREGAPERARARLQGALDRRLAGPAVGEPEITPMLQYRLSRALRALGRDPEESAALAAAAREGLEAIAATGDFAAALADLRR